MKTKKLVKFNVLNSEVSLLTLLLSNWWFYCFNSCFYSNLPADAFSLPTRAFNLATRTFTVPTLGFELVTLGFELVARGFGLVTREFELVTRNLCFTFFPGLDLSKGK